MALDFSYNFYTSINVPYKAQKYNVPYQQIYTPQTMTCKLLKPLRVLIDPGNNTLLYENMVCYTKEMD